MCKNLCADPFVHSPFSLHANLFSCLLLVVVAVAAVGVAFFLEELVFVSCSEIIFQSRWTPSSSVTNLIDSNMVQGVSVENGVIQNINPATGQLIEPAVSVTSPEEIESIVSAANLSQQSWSDKTLSERIEAIRQGLIAVEPIADELADVILKRWGKSLPKRSWRYPMR